MIMNVLSVSFFEFNFIKQTFRSVGERSQDADLHRGYLGDHTQQQPCQRSSDILSYTFGGLFFLPLAAKLCQKLKILSAIY
jgi:hypothetical protein